MKIYMYPAHDVDEYKVITEKGLELIRTGRSGLLDILGIIRESDTAALHMNRLDVEVSKCISNPTGEGGWDETLEDVKLKWRTQDMQLKRIIEFVQVNPDLAIEHLPMMIAGASCDNLCSEELITPGAYEDEQYPFIVLKETAASLTSTIPYTLPFELILLEYGSADHKKWADWILD